MPTKKNQEDELCPLRVCVRDETSKLTKVILGIATDLGPSRGINSKAAAAIRDKTYPSEQKLSNDLLALEQVLISNNIKILKPKNIANVNQIFVRDLGFAIDDFFVVCNPLEEVRIAELEGIVPILDMIEADKLIYPPEEVIIEGGDIVQYNNTVFVGLSKRTNKNSIPFLQDLLPNKTVVPLKLKGNTDELNGDVLHLDCTFQPVGEQSAILCQKGFEVYPGDIIDIFDDQIIYITEEEMYQLVPNVLSISKNRLISCNSFDRVNKILIERGIDVLAIPFETVGILGGLLRCSTLPLERCEL